MVEAPPQLHRKMELVELLTAIERVPSGRAAWEPKNGREPSSWLGIGSMGESGSFDNAISE